MVSPTAPLWWENHCRLGVCVWDTKPESRAELGLGPPLKSPTLCNITTMRAKFLTWDLGGHASDPNQTTREPWVLAHTPPCLASQDGFSHSGNLSERVPQPMCQAAWTVPTSLTAQMLGSPRCALHNSTTPCLHHSQQTWLLGGLHTWTLSIDTGLLLLIYSHRWVSWRRCTWVMLLFIHLIFYLACLGHLYLMVQLIFGFNIAVVIVWFLFFHSILFIIPLGFF